MRGKRQLSWMLALVMLASTGMTALAENVVQKPQTPAVFVDAEQNPPAPEDQTAPDGQPALENQEAGQPEEVQREEQQIEEIPENTDVPAEEAEENLADESVSVIEALSLEELAASGRDIMYLCRLYDETKVSEVKAEFWKENPFVEGEIPSDRTPDYSQYMTRVDNETYGIEVHDAGYRFVRFNYKQSDGTQSAVRNVYQFQDAPVEGINQNPNLSYIKYEKESNNCIYVGRNGLRSYIDRHHAETMELVENYPLYIDMSGSGYQPFTKTEADGTKVSYLKLYYGENPEDYIEVTGQIPGKTDFWALFLPKGKGLTTHTRFRLLDARSESGEGQDKIDGETRFYYTLTEEKRDDGTISGLRNLIRPANLHTNERFWGVYRADYDGTRKLAFNSFLANLQDVKISWSMDGGVNWSKEQTMTRTGASATAESFSQNCLWEYDQVPANATHVKFQGNDAAQGETVYQSGAIAVTDAYEVPCWFAHRKAWKNSGEQSSELEGFWSTRYSINRSGDGGVDIASGEFQKDGNLFYVRTDFYDYYSDAELFGRKAYEADAVAAAMEGGQYKQAPILNSALSAWYREKDGNKGKPDIGPLGQKHSIYFGSAGVSVGAGVEKIYSDAGRGGIRNVYDGYKKNHVYTGIMDAKLGADGKPTQCGFSIPLFDESWLRGNNSYDTALGQVYDNVLFPFRKEGEYWIFDSAAKGTDGKAIDAVQLKNDPDDGYYLERTGKGIPNPQKDCGFFPFDDASKVSSGPSRDRDYMFGMRMSVPFTLTESKQIKLSEESAEDIQFAFSGDDDVWLYIDGQLVLDLGGIHDALSATINFRTGEITYGNPKDPVAEKDQVTKQSVERGITAEEVKKRAEFVKSLASDQPHTLTMFYMERGLEESNMKIRFNFLVENKLTVSNTIRTKDHTFFEAAEENIGAVNYRIYNQAVSGESLPVNEAAGGFSLGTPVKLNDGSGEITPVTEQPPEEEPKLTVANVDEDGTAALKYASSYPSINWTVTPAEEKKKRAASIEIQGGAAEISGQAYLRMEVKSNVNSTTGGQLRFKFIGDNGAEYECTAENAMYQGSNNSLYKGLWNVIRLDLTEVKKALGTAKVRELHVSYSDPVTLHLRRIELYQEPVVKDSLGFAVEPSQISDYGSITSKKDEPFASRLSPAGLAPYVYYTGADTHTYSYTDANGIFSLASGQSVEFVDKFRPGSYIHLHEELADPEVFHTTYTVYEKPKGKEYQEIHSEHLLPGRYDVKSIVNSGQVSTLTNVEGRAVKDGRKPLDGSGQAIDSDPQLLPCEERDHTIVYRNYEAPDTASGTAIDLKVDYNNTVRYGDVEITKIIDFSNAIASDKNFNPQRFVERYNADQLDKITFTIEFSNIMNRYLERQTPEQQTTAKMTVEKLTYDENTKKASGTAVFRDIPAGTEYTVTEDAVYGMSLQQIRWGASSEKAGETKLTAHKNLLETAEAGTKEIRGQAYSSVQHLTAENVYVSPVTIEVEKVWEGAAPNEKEVKVKLQRSVNGGAYEDVRIKEGASDGSQITDGNSGNPWIQTTSGQKASFTDLPVYGKTDAGEEYYTYRVVEVEVPNGYEPVYEITGGTGGAVLVKITNISANKEYYVRRNVLSELPVFDEQTLPLKDYTVEFVNKDPLRTSDVMELKDGKITFRTAQTGNASFHVKLTPKEGTTGTARSSVVMIHVYDLQKDIYVLDYGLPAMLADSGKNNEALTNGMFANDTCTLTEHPGTTNEIAGVTGSPAGAYEAAAANENGNGKLEVLQTSGKKDLRNTSVKFTPTKFMDCIDTYRYKTIIRKPGEENLQESAITVENGVVMTEEVKIMPASTVYYEDNFGGTENKDSQNGIVYGGNYKVTTPASTEFYQGITNELYGYDEAYLETVTDIPGRTDSLGTVTEMSAENSGTAEFTFTGTGFDVIGRTDNASAKIMYVVRTKQATVINGKNYAADAVVKLGIVDPFYEADEENALRQLPVVSVRDLPRGSYQVLLRLIYQTGATIDKTRFFMDGLRIYSPIEENEFYDAAERGAVVMDTWKLLLGDTKLSDQGTIVPGQPITGAKAAVVYSDGTNIDNIWSSGSMATEIPGVDSGVVGTEDMNDYLTLGPKYEVYLPKDSGLAFLAKPTAGADSRSLQIEAKAVYTPGSSAYPVLKNVGSSQEIAVNSTTAMYYPVETAGCKRLEDGSIFVVLANTSDTNVSLTNLKVKGYEIAYPSAEGLIKPMASVKPDEGLDAAKESYYHQLSAEKTAEVTVHSVRFARQYVRQENEAYVNITLKGADGAYIPQLYRYDQNSKTLIPLETASPAGGVIDPETLKPIRNYQDASGNCYDVFKVKVKIPQEYAEGAMSFAAAAVQKTDTEITKISSDMKYFAVMVKLADWSPVVEVIDAEVPTNKSVMVCMTLREDIRPLDGWQKNDRMYVKSFAENGEYRVEVTDQAGYQEAVTFSVSNIDREQPTAEVTLGDGADALGRQVTLAASEPIRPLDGWQSVDECTYTSVYAANGTNSTVIEDLAGNQSLIEFTVSGIDEAPQKPSENAGSAEQTQKPQEDRPQTPSAGAADAGQILADAALDDRVADVVVDGVSYPKEAVPEGHTKPGTHTVRLSDDRGDTIREYAYQIAEKPQHEEEKPQKSEPERIGFFAWLWQAVVQLFRKILEIFM